MSVGMRTDLGGLMRNDDDTWVIRNVSKST